jgi:hypothetical protein
MDFLAFHDPDLKLSLWMARFRNEMSLRNEMGTASWTELANIFGRAGYRNERSMPPTAETAKLLWASVHRLEQPRPAAPCPPVAAAMDGRHCRAVDNHG